MTLDGYETQDVKPAEDASGGKAVTCPARAEACSATMKYSGAPGWYDLRVQYFDQANGAAGYRAYVGKQLIDEWSANLDLPRATGLSSTTSTRRLIHGVALRPGDEIRIEGKPDGMDLAGLDYVELVAPVAQGSRPAR
jgi:alpha-glucuronidase